MKNKSAFSLSIRMIIVIALSVFVIFMVMEFVSGGWSYFTKTFRETTETSGPGGSATIRCRNLCNGWTSAGCPVGGYFYEQVNTVCHMDVDWDNDGEADGYYCVENENAPTDCEIGAILSKSECSCL